MYTERDVSDAAISVVDRIKSETTTIERVLFSWEELAYLAALYGYEEGFKACGDYVTSIRAGVDHVSK